MPSWDLAIANAEKKLLLGAGLFPGNMFMHVEQRVMVPVARSAPVTATTAPSGVLVCETVCAVLVYENFPQPLLCAQLLEPLTLPKRMYSYVRLLSNA